MATSLVQKLLSLEHPLHRMSMSEKSLKINLQDDAIVEWSLGPTVNQVAEILEKEGIEAQLNRRESWSHNALFYDSYSEAFLNYNGIVPILMGDSWYVLVSELNKIVTFEIEETKMVAIGGASWVSEEHACFLIEELFPEEESHLVKGDYVLEWRTDFDSTKVVNLIIPKNAQDYCKLRKVQQQLIVESAWAEPKISALEMRRILSSSHLVQKYLLEKAFGEQIAHEILAWKSA